MTHDHSQWRRNTAVRKFHEAIAGADRAGQPMSDIRAARAAAGYVNATAQDVLRWVREAGA